MYALLALLVTTIQEALATAFNWRANDLYAAIRDMLTNGEQSLLVQKLYAHPLLKNLVQKELGKLPSYVPSKTFAIALLDVLQGQTTVSTAIGADKALTGAKKLVSELPDNLYKDLKRTLTLLIADAERYEQDVDKQAIKFSEGVEAWFNDRMARAQGWYKRKAQYWSLGLAVAVSAACNANSIQVAWRLWIDGSLRAAVVSSAQQFHNEATMDLAASHIPIGWSGGLAAALGHGGSVALMILGWLITAVAVSLGSAFWFDVLSRLIQLRGAGAKVSSVDGKVKAATS
jgi:hypothetical protein